MGKSPGKWIKGILFGKKTSKSNLSKGRELSKSASEKPARVSSKEPISTLTVDAPLISNPVLGTVVDSTDNSNFQKEGAAKLASDRLVSPSTKQDGDMPTVSDCSLPNSSENIKLEQAARVVQASFRSYQARRAFRTLKEIIRLQAFVRGCLVRRQAVSTLFCLQGIVKLQAITRGHMVRRSSITGNRQCGRQSLIAKDAKNQDSCGSKYSPDDTLLKNAFVYKLLSSSPTAMPLCLQYGPGEPNSAWDWLRKWSISRVWSPSSKHGKTHDSKLLTVETEETKPKSNDWRVRSATVRKDPNHANAETQDLKQKGRKLSIQAVKSGQDHPQNGNDKSKRGLKKTPKPVSEISNEAEVDIEKRKIHPVKLSKSRVNKPIEDLAEAVSEHNDVKSSLELPGAIGPVDELNCHLNFEEHTKLVSDKSQDILLLDKDSKDNQIGGENYKSSRRTSLPGKHDDQDATPESVMKVPSYMATTASSKAKFKVQVSPRFGQDGVDNNGLTRRHSLPSSTNGKLSSSPRVHRLVQVTGREGTKVDRSLSSSRDVIDKAIQVDWKR